MTSTRFHRGRMLLDWYLPYIACAQVASGAKATFVNLWRHAVRLSSPRGRHGTLRDYHSQISFGLPSAKASPCPVLRFSGLCPRPRRL